MRYDFDQLPDRRSTESIKWNRYPEDVLPLWVADLDFPSPQPVIQALHKRIEHGVFGYPKELPGLREIIAERFERLYGWQVKEEELVLVPGVATGFTLACHLAANLHGSGDVLVQTPLYSPILSAPEKAGLGRRDALLQQLPDGSYGIDWDAFEAAFTEETRLFILCNPHNPVGRVFRQDELERMAEICLERRVLICSDEIHCELLYSGQQHLPIASLEPEIARNTITLAAPSKTFNLAGFHFSVAVVQDRQLRKQYIEAQAGLVTCFDIMAMIAAKAAYEHGQEWQDQLLAYLGENRDYVYEMVNGQLPGISMAKPEGTFLAWLDCREAQIEGSPYKFFLKNARVAGKDGAEFGLGGEGFLRLNFGCPRSVVEEALKRMQAALESTG